MFWRTPTSRFDRAPCKRTEPQPQERRLRDRHDRTVVFADGGFRVGPAVSPAAAGEVWPIPLLAGILTPFVGKQAGATADALLKQFGSIDRIVSASETQLLKICASHGEVGKMIIAARTLIEVSLKEQVIRTPVDVGDPVFLRYLVLKLKHAATEELHAIYLDACAGFLGEGLISCGDLRSVASTTSAIFRRALDLDASGLILVHNHPSRSPDPSEDDLSATEHLVRAAKVMGLHIIDHIIVAGNSTTSFRARGLM
jgi:DNA repair protein RadC